MVYLSRSFLSRTNMAPEARGEAMMSAEWTRRLVVLGAAGLGLAGAAYAYRHHASAARALPERKQELRREEEEAVPTEKDVQDFEKACEFVSSTTLVSAGVFGPPVLLELYGLYKQATEGDLNASLSAGWAASAWGWIKSASSLSPREEAKRRSWLRCRGMSRGRAMTMYVGKVLARCAQRELDFKLDGEPEEAEAGWVATSTLRDAYHDEEDGEGGPEEETSDWFNAVADDAVTADAIAALASRATAAAAAGETTPSTPTTTLASASASGSPSFPPIEEVTERDGKLRSCLHWAADNGNADLVRALLLNRADPNSRDEDGQTPLHYAAICEYREIYDMLVGAGADENAEDGQGETPASWVPEHWRGGSQKQFIGWNS